MSSGYIYLLQPLCSINSNEQIYKIGKTKRKNFKRFNEYPLGSILILQSSSNDCDLMERKLLKLFDEKFIKKTDYGREYFEGNLIEMKKIINSELMNEEYVKNVVNDNIINDNNIDYNNILLKQFSCKLCNYNTSKESDYNKHLLTMKHKSQISDDKKTANDFICSVCSKKYKSRVGLWSHKKKCFAEKKIEYDSKENIDFTKLHNPILNNSVILQILNDNKEFKNMIIEDKKNCNKLMKIMIEIMQNKTTINSL